MNIEHVNEKEHLKRPSINEIILSHENINKDDKKKHKKLYLKKEENNNNNNIQTEEQEDKHKNTNNNIVLPIIKDANHLNVSFEFKNKKLKPVIKATGLSNNNNSLLTKSLNIHRDNKFWKKENFNNNIGNKDNMKK